MLHVPRYGLSSSCRIDPHELRRNWFREDTLCIMGGMNYRSLYQLALLMLLLLAFGEGSHRVQVVKSWSITRWNFWPWDRTLWFGSVQYLFGGG